VAHQECLLAILSSRHRFAVSLIQTSGRFHMPNSRPNIPVEVQRMIFVQAGHRCACCGVPFPLERAHIVPWSQSQDHSESNLLCLCANCHEMADKSWDRRTFDEYKRRPWVIRRAELETGSSRDDPVESYLSTADGILVHLSEIQCLLAERDTARADLVLQRVVKDALKLYSDGIRLRARVPPLRPDQLSVLEAVYEIVARLLNEKSGNLLEIADALARAKQTVGMRYGA